MRRKQDVFIDLNVIDFRYLQSRTSKKSGFLRLV